MMNGFKKLNNKTSSKVKKREDQIGKKLSKNWPWLKKKLLNKRDCYHLIRDGIDLVILKQEDPNQTNTKDRLKNNIIHNKILIFIIRSMDYKQQMY